MTSIEILLFGWTLLAVGLLIGFGIGYNWRKGEK